jgi:C4-dicarboxylate-specific signal transduction histidine kinase
MKGPTDAELRRLAEVGLQSAGLVHELRQPLFAVKALAQLASAEFAAGHAEAGAGHIHSLLQQVGVLESLVGAHNEFSRRLPGAREIFDLSVPVGSAMAMLGPRASAAGVALLRAEWKPTAVSGAPLAVLQAVVNLGQNAIEAVQGRAGGGVEVGVFAEAGSGLVRVRDNGPGLPEVVRTRLFSPFVTTKPGGTGLGLALAKQVIEDAGGTLHLGEGDGVTWTIRLPAG